MGAKAIPVIEKKRIVDEIMTLKKKNSLTKACEIVGVSIPSYWNYKKALKRAGMTGEPHGKKKFHQESPSILPKGLNPVIKIYLQDATFALTEGTFRAEEGQMSFEGKGFIKIDSK